MLFNSRPSLIAIQGWLELPVRVLVGREYNSDALCGLTCVLPLGRCRGGRGERKPPESFVDLIHKKLRQREELHTRTLT